VKEIQNRLMLFNDLKHGGRQVEDEKRCLNIGKSKGTEPRLVLIIIISTYHKKRYTLSVVKSGVLAIPQLIQKSCITIMLL
jgi:hypothetical protein